MKIGIVTIIDYINYGNRLQNYAVQKILEQMGHTVDTIVAVSYRRSCMNVVKKIAAPAISLKRPYIKREKEFKKFTKEYINEKKIYTYKGDIPESINKKYDFFVLGSDQIWNPEFINFDVPNGGIKNRFLDFAENRKKIAISPSFGVSEISDEFKEIYKNGLSRFYKLSVREDAGAEIIKKLIGKTADVLIDPTLMLTASQWKSIAKPAPINYKKPYILKYVLGNESEEYKKYIKSIAQTNDLEIHEMMSLNEKNLYDAAPDVFIDLVANASLVCTDSFHATVFSILFGKPFLLHEREDALSSMNSRLETLLRKLHLENRFPDNIKYENIFDADYNEAYRELEKERKAFREYLEKSFCKNEV